MRRSLVQNLVPEATTIFVVRSFKDLFDTGMGTVEPAVRTVYGSPYRWGSEGGFGGVRTSRYQYVQGKKVFSRGGP
jgi:hypothetical protein